MKDKKLKTSVIVHTLTEIQKNYDEDSLEYLVLYKAKDLFIIMNRIRARLKANEEMFKSVEETWDK